MKARKDLLDIASLDDEELAFVLDSAGPAKEVFHRPVKQAPRLRGKTVLLLFYEPSTRTSTSFEVVAKRLSADVINFPMATSSVLSPYSSSLFVLETPARCVELTGEGSA